MTTALSNISSVQVWQFFHWSETATVFNNGWTGDTSPIWGHIFLYFVDYWPLACQANTLDLLGSVSVLQHMRTIHTDSWPSQREKEIKIIQSKCQFFCHQLTSDPKHSRLFSFREASLQQTVSTFVPCDRAALRFKNIFLLTVKVLHLIAVKEKSTALIIISIVQLDGLWEKLLRHQHEQRNINTDMKQRDHF